MNCLLYSREHNRHCIEEEETFFVPRINENSRRLARHFRQTQEDNDLMEESFVCVSERASSGRVIDTVHKTNLASEVLSRDKDRVGRGGGDRVTAPLSPISVHSELSRINNALDHKHSLDETTLRSFPKPSFFLKARNTAVQKSEDSTRVTARGEDSSALFDSLHKDSVRRARHVAALQGKFYPPDQHTPRLHHPKHIRLPVRYPSVVIW